MNARADPRTRQAVPRRRRGQGLTETVVIVFLVAVGTIGIVGLFGDNLRNLFGTSAGTLAGSTRAPNGGTQASAGLLKWSLKGAEQMGQTHGHPGGSANAHGVDPRGGNPGGSANAQSPHSGGGNPGGTANSEQ